MAEWLKAMVSKIIVLDFLGTGGSNPPLSASMRNIMPLWHNVFLLYIRILRVPPVVLKAYSYE